MAAWNHIVARARDPGLFAAWAVPDTLDGRFDMLALHAFLVLNRLKGEPSAKEFAQILFDTMFADLDRGVAAFQHVHGYASFAPALELNDRITDLIHFFRRQQPHAINKNQVCHAPNCNLGHPFLPVP